MPTKEELLAKANQPAEDAMRLHSFYQGKMQMMPKCPRVAVATAMQAQQQGIAALTKSREQLHKEATTLISKARQATELLVREGIIAAPP